MAFMDYMPQFGQNTNEQPPADDAQMQMEMKRRMAFANSLRDQQMPQGEMVSGRYVAPSWTQQLANVFGKYVAGKVEDKALGQYRDYTKTKQEKLGTLLEDLQRGKETKTFDNTPYQIQVPTGQAPQTENLGGMQPIQNGMKTIDVPMTNTTSTYKPYSQKEFMSKVGSVMPEMLPKMLENQFAQYAPKAPIELGAGGKLINPNTYEVLATNPKESADSLSTLEKEYNFMKDGGYKGSREDFFNLKRSMTEKERQDFDIKLRQLGIDQYKLFYETGYGNPPGAGQDVNAAALAWANANPNDPRAAKIKNKLGVK